MKTRFRAIACLVPALILLPTGCKDGSLDAEREAWEAERVRLEADIRIAQESALVREKQLQEQMTAIEKASREDQENLIKQMEQERENTRQQMEKAYQLDRELASAKSLLSRAGISMPTNDGQAPADMRAEATKKRESLVVIEGEGGKGFGVLVREGDKLWLYTAAHVFGGHQKLTITAANGNKLTRFGQLQVAGAADVARLEVQEAEGFTALEWVPADRTLRENMGLIVLGEGDPWSSAVQGTPPAAGQPVLIVGSGSPVGGAAVFDANDAGLLGIIALPAAKRGELFQRGVSGFSAMNSAFLRPLGEMDWKTVGVAAYLTEGRMIAEYDAMTRVASALACARYAAGQIQFEGLAGNGGSPMQVLEDHKKFPAVAELLGFNAAEDASTKKIKPNEQDVRRKAISTLTSAAAAVRQSAQGFEPAKFTGVNRVKAEESVAWRATADQALRDNLANFGKP
ncbi:MAG: hypothetical protein ACKO2G_01750 [Verrucomicrobiales bacterium]